MPDKIPIDDERVFELMRAGNMDGLFQVEGALYGYLQEHEAHNTTRSRIVASIALYRPGPLESGMVDDYVKVERQNAITSTTSALAIYWRKRTAPWSTRSRS